MEKEIKKPVSISRSQFQANSLKILRRSEEDKTPVLVTKYGLPTHILVPLDRTQVIHSEQIQVESYVEEALTQFWQK